MNFLSSSMRTAAAVSVAFSMLLISVPALAQEVTPDTTTVVADTTVAPATDPIDQPADIAPAEVPAVDTIVAPDASTSVEAAAVITAPVVSPTLSTDQTDYAPGSLVTVFGHFFSALGNFVLHLVGTNEDGSQSPEVTQAVAADTNGDVTTTFTLENIFRPIYNLFATDSTGATVAQTTFTDAVTAAVDMYSQCANGSGLGPVCNWTNGNLNAQNSVYSEGDATVQRLAINDLTPGIHTVTIQYDSLKGGKHAYDFLTDDTFSESWVTSADLCSSPITNFASCASATPVVSSVIPTAPNAGGYDTLSSNRRFTIRNGTWVTIGTPIVVSGADQPTNIQLTFNVPANCADKYQKQGTDVCEVLVSFGAHISRQVDWGIGNSAVNISGSPYHVRVVELDNGTVGNRDNQMSATAIVLPNTITIHKVTVGGDATFSFTGVPAGSITTSGGNGPALSANPANGSGSITESALSGWALTGLACTVSGGATATPNQGTRTVNYTMPSTGGGGVDCTFTNTLQQGHIIVDKVTVPSGDAQSFAFTTTGTGYTGFSLTDAAAANDQTLNAGSYSVAETAVSGWTQTSATCTDGATSYQPSAITLGAGKTVTCTFTNTKKGHLIVQKTTVPAADPTSFTISATGSGTITSGGSGSVTDATDMGYEVTPGTYSVAETVPTGWAKTGDTCQGVVVGAGQTTTCLLTNTKEGTVIVKKVMVGGTGTFAYTGTPSGSISSNNGTISAPVAPGQYVAVEAATAGWDLTSVTCSDNDSAGSVVNANATFNVAAGETVTCTFTNTKRAQLTIHKDSIGAAGTFNFTTTGGLIPASPAITTTLVSGNVYNGNQAYSNVTPGTYTVAETAQSGWDLTSSTCNFNGAAGDTVYVPGSNLVLNPGDVVVCTFINTKRPTLTLVKTVVNDNGGNKVTTDFQGKVDGTNVAWTAATEVTVGAHTATETNLPGYTASVWGGDCAADGSVTLAAGENKTCSITNDDNAAHLIVIKHVVTDNGGTAVASGFSTTISGVTTAVATAAGAEAPGVDNVLTTVGSYSVDEGAHAGYAKTLSTDCVGTIALGETKTCTITNDDIQPKLTLTKVVVNDNGGQKVVADFPLFVDATGVTSGVQNGVNAGAHTATETGSADYTASIWTGDCAANGSITLLPGDVKACTITNDDNAPALHLRKVVINDNGGTATVANFTLTANGTGTNDLTGASPVDSGTGLKADTFALSETNVAGYTASAWTCVGGTQSGSNITLGLGQEATCTITNDDQQSYIILNKTVVNDNGGTALADDFLLKVDGGAALDEVALTVNPGVHVASETLLAGYAAGSWGTDCDASGNVTVALGQTKTCTITNNDIAPKLHLRKVVINDNGGTATVANFTLTADGAGSNDLSGTSPVDSGATLQADTFALSETNVTGYTASAWVCVGGNQSGSSITVGLGGEATCTITNNDIAPKLHLRKVVINDNGGTALDTAWTLTANGAGTNDLTGSTPVDSDIGLKADTFVLSESGPSGYSASAWSCIGGTQNGSNVTVGLGGEATCTITNDDITPHLIVIKHVINHGGSAGASNFTMNITGTNVSNSSSAGVESPGTNHTLNVGGYSVDESANADYTKTLGTDCAGTVALGETKTCTITNEEKTAKLTIVKDAQPNDLIDFSFSGTGSIGSFLLDDDAGVAEIGINGDTHRGNTKVATGLNTGSYTVTETEPNSFWTLGGATCVTTGTATPYASNLVGTALTLNLTPGSDVTCTFVNNKNSPTRTIGFWQTHTAFTTAKFLASPLNGSMPIGLGTHKGFITSAARVFGAFYSSIPKTSTGAKRTDLDKVRMQLLQQLVGAKLNCASFGCSSSVQTMIVTADTAYAGTSISAILASASAMDAYNNSGDTIIIGNAGSATPNASKAGADYVFWDLP